MDDPKLIAALHAADAAGDTAGAQAIASHIKALRGPVGSPVDTANAAPVGGSPAQAAPAPVEGMLPADGSGSFLDRTRLGLANVGIKGYMGAKNLFTPLSAEDKSVLEMSDADVKNSGFAGKTANVLGNVGAGIAASVATPAMAGPAFLAKSMPYIKAMLGSGAYSAATEPIANAEDMKAVYLGKAKEAAKAAALGVGVTGALQGAGKVATGLFTPTKDAKDLIDQGIIPTLQQGSEGRVGKFIGGLTSGSTHVRDRQEQQVLDSLTDRISQGQTHLPGSTLNERVALLDASLAKDYDSVLTGKKMPMTGSIRDEVLSQADNIKRSGGRFLDEQSDARGILDNIIGTNRNAVRMKPETLRNDYLNRIQQSISDSNHPLVNEALVNAKNVLIQRSRNAPLTADEIDQLRTIDSRYFDMQRLADVARGSPAGHETGIDVSRLARSYAKGPGQDVIGATNKTAEEVVGPLTRTLSMMPRQDEARTLRNNIFRTLGVAGGSLAVPGAALVTAPAYAMSLGGQTSLGAKALFGQTGPQKALKDALDSPMNGDHFEDFLRILRDNSSTLGASLSAGR